MADPYNPSDINQMRQKFFSNKRADLERSAIGAQQQTDDAINRRFTAMGQTGSGAAIGAQMKAREGIQANINTAKNDLAGQEMQSEMSQQLADRDFGLKKDIFENDKVNQSKQFDLAEKQFGLDSDTTAFNRRLAEMELNKKNPGLFGMGGMLGTGLGSSKGFWGTGIGSGDK